jgi:hypothetical protein
MCGAKPQVVLFCVAFDALFRTHEILKQNGIVGSRRTGPRRWKHNSGVGIRSHQPSGSPAESREHDEEKDDYDYSQSDRP